MLADALSAEACNLPDVEVTVSLPDEPGVGGVVIELDSWAQDVPANTPAAERARIQQRMMTAWQNMAKLTAWLFGGTRRRYGSTAPRVVLVSLHASFSTTMQTCRHRTTAKLVIRCAKVIPCVCGCSVTCSCTFFACLLCCASGAIRTGHWRSTAALVWAVKLGTCHNKLVELHPLQTTAPCCMELSQYTAYEHCVFRRFCTIWQVWAMAQHWSTDLYRQ